MNVTVRQWILVDTDDDTVVEVFEDPEMADEMKAEFDALELGVYKVVMATISWQS